MKKKERKIHTLSSASEMFQRDYIYIIFQPIEKKKKYVSQQLLCTGYKARYFVAIVEQYCLTDNILNA